MKSKKIASAVAASAVAALVLTACGGGGNRADEGGGGGEAAKPEVLTVSFWSPIAQETLDQFKAETGIRVDVTTHAEAGMAQEAIRNGLAAGGAGLSDVHFLEVDWFPEMMAVPEDWATLPEIPGRWVDWKVAQGTVDGEIKGYGTDIGPLAVAFNSEMMAAAGLPSEPDDFAEFIGGEDATWDTFLEAGRQFEAASGTPWINSMGDAFQAAINALPAAYENPETGNPWNLADNTEVKELFDLFGGAITEGLSAGISIWSPDAGPGIQQQAFATIMAPAWMMGHIQEQGAGATGWRIATAFPNGGGNWGGSFVGVPATGDNVYWATQLADFLTTPEAMVRQFVEQGHFPSQVDALADPELTQTPSEFFGGQLTGQIYSDLAAATPTEAVSGFRGPRFFGIHTLVGDGLARIQDGIEDPATAWQSTVANFEAQGFETD